MFEYDKDDESGYFACDEEGCDVDERFDNRSYMECIEDGKEEGWKIKKEGKEWKHYCKLHG